MAEVASVTWDLGNGVTSTSKSPTTIYTPGWYDAVMTVTDENGTIYTVTKPRYIAVGETDQGLADPDYYAHPRSYHFGWNEKTGS